MPQAPDASWVAALDAAIGPLIEAGAAGVSGSKLSAGMPAEARAKHLPQKRTRPGKLPWKEGDVHLCVRC